jgi:hypothetical protein
MHKFLMRYLLCSFFSILLLSCASDYKNLQSLNPDQTCFDKIAPLQFNTSWYNASVDVMGKHLSGLLLFKNMPDSSYRVVFTNEAGITFFDFGFSKQGDFKVFNVIEQLDKKAVINTLRKDFELVLGLPFRGKPYNRFIDGEEIYFGVQQKNETAYFITNKDCASLQRLEWGSGRKRKVSAVLPGSNYPSPEKIELLHLTFNMQIKLTRIQKE